jgi:hypothetical protein
MITFRIRHTPSVIVPRPGNEEGSKAAPTRARHVTAV